MKEIVLLVGLVLFFGSMLLIMKDLKKYLN